MLYKCRERPWDAGKGGFGAARAGAPLLVLKCFVPTVSRLFRTERALLEKACVLRASAARPRPLRDASAAAVPLLPCTLRCAMHSAQRRVHRSSTGMYK
jgi:hypothetical protein